MGNASGPLSVLAIVLLAGAGEAGPWYGSFLPASVGQWKAAGAVRTYGRSNIFDYMDGAGELYLAYDFQEIAVRDYKKPGAPGITAEVYRMGTSRDAYGVWTADRGLGRPSKEIAAIGQDSDYGAGLLRFWKGALFVRILAERETAESKSAVLALGKLMSGKMTSIGRRPDLLKLLPQGSENVRFFHKHTVLNYHFFLSDSNILNLGPKTDAALAQYSVGSAKPRLLIVRYPTEKDASAAYAGFNKTYLKGSRSGDSSRIEKVERGEYTGVRLDARVLRIVFEAKTREQAEKLLRPK